MIYRDEKELLSSCGIQMRDGRLKIKNLDFFKENIVDNLEETIVISDSIPLRELCYDIVKTAATEFGIYPSSIQNLYEARAREGIIHFTVPAVNLRTLTYDSAKAVFRAAKKINAGAFIFEIARSEMFYTEQRPPEYASSIFLAAIKENYTGPIFLQGDHFQVKAQEFLKNKNREINKLKNLISESIKAGFYNIDIDSSTLVNLSESSVEKQQSLNSEVCAVLTKFIREHQPRGISISIGGEIGEVGGKNTTLDELSAFMQGYLSKIGDLKPISKISVQTGTSHGGVVKPDGSLAEVNLDFKTLKALSQRARSEFGLAGVVQHGASTLPGKSFSLFPQFECAEIHLATHFQNIVFELFPIPLKEKMYHWLHENLADEKKPDLSEEQFIYKTRKKALGPFEKEIYSLSADLRDRISFSLEDEMLSIFEQLNIKDTRVLIDKYIKCV
ncbi:class II fructose-bisphosphate aldolase [Acidobacteriota bacterium]